MNVWQAICVFVCFWIVFLVLELIKAEKTRERFSLRMELVLKNFTCRAETSFDSQSRLAFRLAARILEDAINKEKE